MKNEYETDNRIYRKWIVCTIAITMGLVALVMLITVAVDPFFHYHRPYIRYRLNEERYVNDGISRNFEYDSVIIGNSLFQNFKASQFDELFDAKSIKLPYAGGNTAELWAAVGRIVGRTGIDDKQAMGDGVPQDCLWQYESRDGYKNGQKYIMICLDYKDMRSDRFWYTHDNNPDYLYDEDCVNDINYLLNKDILYRGTFFDILMNLKSKESTSFDDYSSWERFSSPQNACSVLRGVDLAAFVEQDGIVKEDIEIMDNSLKYNILPVVSSNPDTEFIFVIPPVSVAEWARLYSRGRLVYELEGLEHVLSVLYDYDNVKTYCFYDDYPLAEDLDRYCDAIHYDAGVNEWMLSEMADGHHMLTKDNYVRYIEDVKDHYVCYDYSWLSEYCD